MGAGEPDDASAAAEDDRAYVAVVDVRADRRRNRPTRCRWATSGARLQLFNPGLGGRWATTNNLIAAVQMLLPGEVARAHRHTPTAIRFIIEGTGAYTAVDGERVYMAPGDLILTPSWSWHDHGNETKERIVWMDGLDIPLIASLEAMFFQFYTADPSAGDRARPTRPSAVRPRATESRLGSKKSPTPRRCCSTRGSKPAKRSTRCATTTAARSTASRWNTAIRKPAAR